MTVLLCRLVDVLHVVERLQQCLETQSVRVFVHVDVDVKVAQDDNRASVRAERFEDGRQFVEERRRGGKRTGSVDSEQQKVLVAGGHVTAQVLECRCRLQSLRLGFELSR